MTAEPRQAPRSIRFPAKQESLVEADRERLGISFNAWVVRAAAAMLTSKPKVRCYAGSDDVRNATDVTDAVERKKLADCRHPINRRIGTGCGACGKTGLK